MLLYITYNASAVPVSTGRFPIPRTSGCKTARGLQTVDGRILHPELIPDTDLLRHALAELLGKRDNDALRPADVG
jgi:hypothetical protein